MVVSDIHHSGMAGDRSVCLSCRDYLRVDGTRRLCDYAGCLRDHDDAVHAWGWRAGRGPRRENEEMGWVSADSRIFSGLAAAYSSAALPRERPRLGNMAFTKRAERFSVVQAPLWKPLDP